MRIGKIASWAILIGLGLGAGRAIYWLTQGKGKATFFIVLGLMLGIVILIKRALPERTRKAIEAWLKIDRSPQFRFLRVIALVGLIAIWVTLFAWLPDSHWNQDVWLVIWIAILIAVLNLLENIWTTSDLQSD